MGTRACIGIVNPDGTVTHVYTHWDGYPSHHGPILTEAYSTEEKVRELLAMGGVSVLDRSIGRKHDPDGDRPEGMCTFYLRDHGEDDCEVQTSSVAEFFDICEELYAEWVYVFSGGAWRHAPIWQARAKWGWRFT